MYDGYNRIFWGIFITRFSINLGPVKILPSFLGYLLIASGLDSLYEESQLDGYKKYKSLAMLIVVLSIVGGIVGLFTQGQIDTFILNEIWKIGFIIVEFIFYYKIMEVSIGYLNLYNYDELRETYIVKLRKYTILSILNISFLGINLIFNFQTYLKTSLYIAIALSVYLMTMFYGLRDIFEDPDSQEEDEGEIEVINEEYNE